MVTSRHLLVLTICMLSAAEAFAQKAVNFGPPPGPRIHAALSAFTQDDQNIFRGQAKSTFPVIVFVPGVMGSRLVREVEGKEQVIWGAVSAPFDRWLPNLAYDKAHSVTPTLLRTFQIGPHPSPVYDPVIKFIQQMRILRHVPSPGEEGFTDLRDFGYDWRGPNSDSASRLTEWICKNRSALEGRPVVFLAHSMGGLVLKYWLKHERDKSCQGDDKAIISWLEIRRIVFGGTPHYGSPQSLFVFSDKFRLVTGWKAWLPGLDYTLSRPINKYGATFPSGYQLLPITDAGCPSSAGTLYRDFKDYVPPFQIVDDTGKPQPADAFSHDLWKKLNWPKSLHIENKSDVEAFRTTVLGGLLESAQKFVCGLADFEVETVVKDVVRVYSDNHSTICGIIARPGRAPVIRRCSGDGTVPAWIAGEFAKSDVTRRVWSSEQHQDIFGADEIKMFLDGYHQAMHRDWQKSSAAVLGSAGVDRLIELYAGTRFVVPSDPGDDLSAPSVARAIAKGVVKKLGMAERGLYDQARKQEDDVTRANGYRVYADLGLSDPERDPWSLSNAAHIYLDNSDFVTTRVLALRAIALADSLKAPEARKIKGLSAHHAAIAAFKLGDTESAKTYRKLAIELGNKKARRNKLFSGLPL